jgi:hypothetical protein
MRLGLVSGIMLSLLGCSGQVELPDCWNHRDFPTKTAVSGQAVALYSPDGPLLITSSRCRDEGQFIATFRSPAEEDDVLDRMRKRSKGGWFGGEAYRVFIAGAVGEASKDYRGNEIIIQEISILGIEDPKKIPPQH